MILFSWSRERHKLILFSQLLTVFTKRFIVDAWHRRCLNKPWVLNIPEFSIHRGYEYTRVLNMFLVLNMSGFWIYHDSEYARFTQGFEYAWLCLNVPKSVWMAFVLHLPIVIPYLKDRFLGKWKFDFFFLWVLRYLILFIVLV